MADRDADALARLFHETYERLAPDLGYETRRDSAVPWEDVPAKNKALMTAVCGEILAELTALRVVAEVKRMTLRPGDVIVLEVAKPLMEDDVTHIYGQVTGLFPGHPLLIVEQGTLAVITREMAASVQPDEGDRRG